MTEDTEKWMPLVRDIASGIKARLPKNTPMHQFEDLIQYGWFGLRDALQSFDESRGVKFATYASRRISGSIWDGLRRVDWVPRQVRDEKSDDVVGMSSMETVAASWDDSGVRRIMADFLVDPNGMAGIDRVDRNDEIDRILRFVHDRTAKAIIILYYVRGLTMNEIGVSLGVSKSRIWQIHSSAMMIIKASHAPTATRTDARKGRSFRTNLPKRKMAKARSILCRQRPGMTYTIATAAKEAGTSAFTIQRSIFHKRPAGPHGLIFYRDNPGETAESA